jgi:Repeat of unknown function (DUF346)
MCIATFATVTAAVVAVLQVLKQDNMARSVALVVANHTNLTLNKTHDEHAHGGFAMPPDSQIPPQKADIFGSQSTGGSIGTGTEGTITYGADGLTLVISWDNPFVGSNSCNAVISGPNASRFKIIHQCGSGNVGAGMKYELFERADRIFSQQWAGPRTSIDGTPSDTAAGDPSTMVYGQQQHIFYRSTDGKIMHVFWDQNADRIFSQQWAGPGTAAGDPSTMVYGQQQHIFYRSTDGKIMHVFWATYF